MTAAKSGKHMYPLSPTRRKEQTVNSLLAAAALFVLVPLLVAWAAPLEVQAAGGAADLAPGQQMQDPGSNSNAPAADQTDGGTVNTNAADANVGGAVTGFWSLAWAKAWPPVRDILMKIWGATKGVLQALWNVSKDIGGSVNADLNANTNAAGAAVNAPVNAAP